MVRSLARPSAACSANLRLHLENAVDPEGCPVQVDQRLPKCRSRMRFGQELPVLGRSSTKPSCGLLIGGLIKHQPVDT
jgi:hypothetical protein